MFSAMCDCQALHPDPEDAESDNEEFEGEEYEEEEEEAGKESGLKLVFHISYNLATYWRWLIFCTLCFMFHDQGHGDVPTFYTYEEGLSHLTAEGQATLQRLEGMLAQSVTQQFHMAGVRTDEPLTEFEGLWWSQFVFEMLIAHQ